MSFSLRQATCLLPIIILAACSSEQAKDPNSRWKSAYDAGLACLAAGDLAGAQTNLSDSIAALGMKEMGEKRARSNLALAGVLFDKRDYQGALIRSREAKFYFESKWDPAKRASSLDESGPHFFNSMLLEGMSLNELKRYDEALPLLQRIQSLEKDVILPVKFHHDSIDALSEALVATGRKSQARMLRDEIMHTASSLPQSDAKSVRSLSYVEALSEGRSAYQGGNFSSAETLFRQAIAKSANQADDSLEMAEALSNLGALYNTQKRYGEARAMLERALSIARKRMDSKDRRLKEYMKRLASVYANLSQWKKAAALDEEALDLIFEDEYKHEKKSHRSRALMDALIDIYTKDGQLSKAEKTARRKLNLEMDAYGKDSRKVGLTYCQLAKVLTLKGDYRQAKDCFEKSLLVLKKSKKTMARDVAEALEAYIECLERMGDKVRAQKMRVELKTMNDALVDDLAGSKR